MGTDSLLIAFTTRKETVHSPQPTVQSTSERQKHTSISSMYFSSFECTFARNLAFSQLISNKEDTIKKINQVINKSIHHHTWLTSNQRQVSSTTETAYRDLARLPLYLAAAPVHPGLQMVLSPM